MKIIRSIVIAAAAASASLSLVGAAQAQELKRTGLVQSDISVPGKETLQVRVDFPPKAASINHRHPGEEIAYVLQGTLEYTLEGQKPVTLKAGEALFIPAGVAHIAKNVGEGEASELATYIVTKGTPLAEPVK
ncbi:cupin domain-containing protein [Ensifer adhaerens]|uniref:cupin domain-containing protein n=1 Tax=Ensifer TaxID=106591 RepID=UPI00177ABB69|nr:cupin domain-containing protein [Ensifer sp. ENS08]MBD9570781.1 cupin domain-containing protein [Ensifer sp. ENS08]